MLAKKVSTEPGMDTGQKDASLRPAWEIEGNLSHKRAGNTDQ